jgi:hypothetical protein
MTRWSPTARRSPVARAVISVCVAATVGACGGGDDTPGSPDAADVTPDADDTITPRVITGRVEAGAEDAPVRAFFRDGTGPWQRVERTGEGTYDFIVTHRRFTFGMTCATPTYQDLLVATATVDDPAPVLITPCDGPSTPPPAPRVTVTGSLGPLHANGYRASIGDWPLSVPTAPATTTYSAEPHPGPTTFTFARITGSVADRLAIFRDVAVAAGTTLDVDLDAEGFDPDQVAVDAVGLAPGFTSFDAFFTPAASAPLSLGGTSDIPATLPAVPAARRDAGDLLELRAFRVDGEASVQRILEIHGSAPAPAEVTLALPSRLRGAAVVATAGDLPIRAEAETYTAPTADPTDYMMWISAVTEHDECADGACYPYWYLTATPAAAGATVELITPDPAELAAIDAWDPRLALDVAGSPAYGFFAYWRHPDGEAYSGVHGAL